MKKKKKHIKTRKIKTIYLVTKVELEREKKNLYKI